MALPSLANADAGEGLVMSYRSSLSNFKPKRYWLGIIKDVYDYVQVYILNKH